MGFFSCCGYTRRDVLRLGALAGAGLATSNLKLFGQAKKGRRIDIHAHVWTPEYLDLMESYGKKDVWVQRNKGAGITQEEMDKRFAQMDGSGVEMQVLDICPQAPHFENKEHAVNAARKANDLIAEAVEKWPKRFVGFCSLPLPHIDESLKELERGLGQLKMKGVAATTTILGRSTADPAFYPLYEELNRRGTIFYIHPAGVGAESPLITDYHITWMLGAPVEDSISVLTMITKGVPKRFPKMKIVNSHLGGLMPLALQRWDNQWGWENPQTPEKPSISAKRMWYDTVGHGHSPAIKAAVDTIGAERMVLGTDFPYEAGPLFKRSIDYISSSGLKPSEAEMILNHNAAAVLGMA